MQAKLVAATAPATVAATSVERSCHEPFFPGGWLIRLTLLSPAGPGASRIELELPLLLVSSAGGRGWSGGEGKRRPLPLAPVELAGRPSTAVEACGVGMLG